MIMIEVVQRTVLSVSHQRVWDIDNRILGQHLVFSFTFLSFSPPLVLFLPYYLLPKGEQGLLCSLHYA